jgi:beta-galactosidase
MRKLVLLCLLALAAPAHAFAQAPPRASTLADGWEMREVRGDTAQPQQPPSEESAPEEAPPPGPTAPVTPDPDTVAWRPANVPSVFSTQALAPLYPGEQRRFRLRFRGPRTPPGYRWAFVFESVRRTAGVYLNGRRIGGSRLGYVPFRVMADGLRPGRMNELLVVVDGRKDPRVREGWWNWAGIVRPVRLVPIGPAHVDELGTMSRVRCRGPARRCRAELLVRGVVERRGAASIRPRLSVALRAPGGRVTRRSFLLPRQRAAKRRLSLSMRVPAPKLWSPESPNLYRATIALRERGRVVQVERRQVGLRSVAVKGGQLYLNNRRIELRGASLHEDMPGSGAALTAADMDQIVRDYQEVGATVARAHYLLNDRLLARFDRAGIMVWSQAAIWQADHGAQLLWRPRYRRQALETVRRTVREARNHPSVITHSVANELSFTPDTKPGTRRFLTEAQALARDTDPTLPISVDIKGRPGFFEQFTYHRFDMLGINQYFGWYRWVEDFSLLEPYLQEMRDWYPRHALVMTEYGAEARPELASAPPDLKGGYAFQAMHFARTQDVVDRSHVLSGSIYWTLREFEIYPGWTGGAGRRPRELGPNTRHHKGLLGYEGEKKPAWHLARERWSATPLYP